MVARVKQTAIVLLAIGLLFLGACTISPGSRVCVDDGYCSNSEHLIGNCADCRPDFEPGNMDLSYADGTLYARYCIVNSGGVYEGPLTFAIHMGGDVDVEEITELEEITEQVNFDEPILLGDLRVVRSADGISISHTIQNPEAEERAVCFSRQKEVAPSANYYFRIDVNSDRKVEEISYDNNYGSTRIDGEPVSFPEFLIEQDVGTIEYLFSASGPLDAFPSGGMAYYATYLDSAVKNQFRVTVWVPKVPAEGKSLYNRWDGDVVQTEFGPVKVQSYNISLEEDRALQAQAVWMLYLGRNGELVQAGLVRPAEEDFNPAEHPLFRMYLKKYSGGIEPPPTDYCGNGRLDVDEECDDRNRINGDGCSECKWETSFCAPEGYAARFIDGDRRLLLQEPLGDVIGSFNRNNLPALGVPDIITPRGGTAVEQTLLFGSENTVALERAIVAEAENEEDVTGDFLVIEDNYPFFELKIGFREGLKSSLAGTELEYEEYDDAERILAFERLSDGSQITVAVDESGEGFIVIDGIAYAVFVAESLASTGVNPPIRVDTDGDGTYDSVVREDQSFILGDAKLQDLRNVQIPFMDESLDIVAASINGGIFRMTLLRDGVSDTLREGEKKIYTVGERKYDVSLVFVSDPVSGNSSPEAKFAVNGQLSDALGEGETDLIDGLILGVTELLADDREGIAGFFIGTDKIDFVDPAPFSEDFAGSVEINNELIEDAQFNALIERGLSVGTESLYSIKALKYRLSADSVRGSDLYIPSVRGVKEFLDEPEGLISPTFNLRYGGLDTLVLAYEDYDRIERVVAFSIEPLGGLVKVPVNTAGEGSLIHQGHTYRIMISDVSADSPELDVDSDGDGQFDRTLEFGSSFVPKQGGAVHADVHVVLGPCFIKVDEPEILQR